MRWWMCILVLVGCGEGSRGRECEPARATGCSGGRTCAVDSEGLPRCLPLAEDPLREGEQCVEAAACDEGMGCVRVGGVARCLRFCVPSADSDAAPCLSGAVPPGTHPYSESAVCLAALLDRPDIGVCVLPCRPGTFGDCPAGLSCGISYRMGMASCISPGVVGAGESCGPDRPCAEGLGCVTQGAARVCWPYGGPDGCPAGSRSQAVPGVLDLTAGIEVRVCVAE